MLKPANIYFFRGGESTFGGTSLLKKFQIKIDIFQYVSNHSKSNEMKELKYHIKSMQASIDQMSKHIQHLEGQLTQVTQNKCVKCVYI